MESPQEGNAVSLDFDSKPQEEYLLSANTAFFEEFDDDDVFLNDSQSADLEASEIPIRIRRISDVIDCVGGTMASSQVKRHSCPSASSEPVYSATSEATNIKDSNKSRHAKLTTESLDLGYSSPGTQSASRSYKGSWFRFSTSNDADSVDAQPHGNKIGGQTSNSNNNSSPEKSNGPSDVATMPVVRDATCYNMDHEYRGVAIIINHDIFSGGASSLSERHGSWKDVEELKLMFYRLDFKVIIWNNLPLSDLTMNLNKLNMQDFSDCDCFAIAVLTHGINSSYVYAKDSPYPVEMLWNKFTADKCPSLAGKPKIFFIQACRGEKLDSGVTLSRDTNTEVDSSGAAYKIPIHADFLISFSSYDGYYSFRHPENGTWFIQSLCAEMNESDHSVIDLLKLMTRVSRRVALDNESYNPDFPWMHQQKQIPTIHTTLIRDVFFKPKSKPPPEPEIIQ